MLPPPGSSTAKVTASSALSARGRSVATVACKGRKPSDPTSRGGGFDGGGPCTGTRVVQPTQITTASE